MEYAIWLESYHSSGRLSYDDSTVTFDYDEVDPQNALGVFS